MQSSASESDPEFQVAPLRATDEQLLAFAFEGVEAQQYDMNRRAAARAEQLADALDFVRRHPHIYAFGGGADAVVTAERCAVLEASARLNLSEFVVRTLAGTADAARQHLPLLWRSAREGFAQLRQIEDAVALLPRFAEHPDALDELDRQLSDLAANATPAAFRARAAKLARRLAPQPEAERHAAAFSKRRAGVENVEDGMSWVNIYTATATALAITRRATVTAKTMSKAERGGRTQAQIIADLMCDWLRGAGTPTAVKTKVFVTVPITDLAPEAQLSVRGRRPVPNGVDLNTEPMIDGVEPIDADTGRHLLLEAGEFTRVITDPVSGVILDMDRRSRSVTRAQREWLILNHGFCTRDGCTRRAVDADIDHDVGFHSARRGPTDLVNLQPLCDPDHAIKDTTRLRFHRRPDLTVQIVSPTGFRSKRWFEPAIVPDRPPF